MKINLSPNQYDLSSSAHRLQMYSSMLQNTEFDKFLRLFSLRANLWPFLPHVYLYLPWLFLFKVHRVPLEGVEKNITYLCTF